MPANQRQKRKDAGQKAGNEWPGLYFLSCAVCLLLLAGCVERRLTVNTNPSGALVLLNDEQIGISPVTVSFNWYGDYNVTIRKAGYETLQTHRALEPPWYDYFPFDFFAQNIYPGRIVDSSEWSFDLQPEKQPDRHRLIQAAEQLEEQTR